MLRTLLALGCLALGMTGCARDGGAPTDREAPLDTRITIGESQPTGAETLRAPPAPHTQGAERFVVAEGQGAGGFVIIEVAPSEMGGWTQRWRLETEAEAWLEERFDTPRGGDVALSQSLNRREKVISKFEPSMVVAPAELRRGEPFQQKVRMTVHPIDDPQSLRDQGNGEREVVYAGEAMVDPDGEGPTAPIRCAHVRSTFKINLAAASVVSTSDVWRVAASGPAPRAEGEAASAAAEVGVGAVVARRDTERATFLGLPVHSRDLFIHWAPPGR